MEVRDQWDSKSNSFVFLSCSRLSNIYFQSFDFYFMYSIQIKYQLIFCVMVNCISTTYILLGKSSFFCILRFLDVTIKYSPLHSFYLKTKGLVQITCYLNWNWFKTTCMFRDIRSVTSKLITFCIILFSRRKIQFIKLSFRHLKNIFKYLFSYLFNRTIRPRKLDINI